jgi:uncharacterized protein (DUF58 family)
VSALATNRWTGIDGVALLVAGTGILARRPSLVLAGAVAIVFVVYARSDSVPPVSLSVTRELSDPTPRPGDEVEVRVRVENTGDRLLPDCRLVDGVPPALEVTDGVARLGTALRPGKRATFSYTVTAVRGEHDWQPLQAVVRSASGARERSVDVAVSTTLRCTPRLETTTDLPLRGLTTPYTGRVETDVAGVGVEFYSTRAYRPGDPVSRIDWNRYARVGELSTRQFREERAANVVLLVDGREEAYVASETGGPNAVERAVDAAMGAFTALLDAGDRVGVAALSPDECWLPPGSGDEHRANARTLFGTHPAMSPTPSESTFFPSIHFRRLRRRLPADAQVLFFSPLVDDYAVTLARRLDAYGHPVTVLSPDPTRADTPGHRLARTERRVRLSGLRRHGIRVVDWADEPLVTAVERAAARWSP